MHSGNEMIGSSGIDCFEITLSFIQRVRNSETLISSKAAPNENRIQDRMCWIVFIFMPRIWPFSRLLFIHLFSQCQMFSAQVRIKWCSATSLPILLVTINARLNLRCQAYQTQVHVTRLNASGTLRNKFVGTYLYNCVFARYSSASQRVFLRGKYDCVAHGDESRF